MREPRNAKSSAQSAQFSLFLNTFLWFFLCINMSNRHKLAYSLRSPSKSAAAAAAPDADASAERKGVDLTALGFQRLPAEIKGTPR